MTDKKEEQTKIIYGCMRLTGDGSATAQDKAFALLDKAVELGIDTFDHADIYAGGRSESVFGKWLSRRTDIRDQLIINSKCGICPEGTKSANSVKHYDFSSTHILDSVRRSLDRLGLEQMDTLILHRFDHLLEGDEVAGALEKLYCDGQVRKFGVSNFSVAQLNHLQSYCQRPFVTHQLEINSCDIDALFDGRLFQCLQLGLSAQAWSPLAGIVHQSERLNEQTRKQILCELDRQSKVYEIDQTAVMLVWLMNHPARIRPVIGTTNIDHLLSAVEHTRNVDYDRQDWYRLFGVIRQRSLE